MNTTQKILIGIVAVAVIVLGVLYGISRPEAEAPVLVNSESSGQGEVQNGSGDLPLTPEGQTTVVNLWDSYAGYLDAARRNDVNDLAKYAYTLSDTCKDAKLQKECNEKMNAVYTLGSKLREADFVNVWEDSKQGILSTNLTRVDTDRDYGYSKSYILFAKDSSGNPKLISLKPNEEWRVKKNPASTTAELLKGLEDLVKDTDMDGLTDQIEKCIFADNMLVVSCEESNPNKRDSDGDGYWDGIGFLIPKK